MYRGMIFSMDKKYVIVATPQNALYKLYRKSTMFIGKEIEFSRKDIIDYSYYLKMVSGVAACICLIMGIALAFIMTQRNSVSNLHEFAYVSMDINPGMEFTINESQKVLKVDCLNDDAKELFKDLDFRGMKLYNAITEVIGVCKEKGIISEGDKASILISGSLNPDRDEYQKEKTATDYKLTGILEGLKENIQKTTDVKQGIITLKTEPKIRNEAKNKGMSPSKYALYINLKKLGKEMSVEDIKNSDVKSLVNLYNDVSKGGKEFAQPTSGEGQTPAIASLTATPLPGMTVAKTPLPTPAVQTPKLSQTRTSANLKSHTVTPVVKPSPTKAKLGTGLKGEYFDNIDLTNLKVTRTDAKVDFNWGIYAPVFGIRDDESYSVRWTGKIKPALSEEYTFYVSRDNGAKLWINNKLIIDKWNNEWSATDSGRIVLEGGKAYDIKLEYFNNGGNGIIRLEWSSKRTRRAVIPAEYLYPAAATSQSILPGNGFGLAFEYFDNDNLTFSKLKGIDSEVNFDWGIGSPDRSIQQDQKFSARWTGYVQPACSEDYVFYVSYDDGARLWIDDQLVLDKWFVSEINVAKSKLISLKAGQKYKIVLEYHNNSMAGKVKLEWESPGTKRSVVPKTRLYPW